MPVLIHAGAGGRLLSARRSLELAARHRSCPIVLAHAAISDLSLAVAGGFGPPEPLLRHGLVEPGRPDGPVLPGVAGPDPLRQRRSLHGPRDGPGDNAALRPLRRARREEAIELVAGGQLENLLAGEVPLDAGPPPGPPDASPSPAETRVATAARCGRRRDARRRRPSQMLELARLAIGGQRLAAGPGAEPSARGTAGGGAVGAVGGPWALAMALTLLATPGVESAAAVA